MSEIQTDGQVRIFCAVELPEEARARVSAHVARLRDAAGSTVKISWERGEKLHLTLKFLGEIEPQRLEALARAATRAAQRVEKFAVSLREAGAFPARGNPRVLWVGLRDEGRRLAELHEQLETECARENFPREARAFHPHITLARIRFQNGATRHLAKVHSDMGFEPVSFTVREFVVMRSQLGAGGSRYTPLSRHELKTEAGTQ